jgi:hypothetical protein
MKMIKYSTFVDMWLNITNEQRTNLLSAWGQRIVNRIDIKDADILDHIKSYASAHKPTTKQAFGLYVSAMCLNINDWYFTSAGVYYSPAQQIYKG